MGPSPRAPFDQGLFLTHFNKGKEYYDGRRYEEAERELEEAYLLRPRDQKVLNLLGLVYFKQEKFEKAEEVYRKLVAESPDAHTLFYNLGLIYFKLSRLEEAESAFSKALDLSRENPKISFYLGSIYERLHRFQDAIFQYRQAGANIMVRRIEDRLAAAGPVPRAAAEPERADTDRFMMPAPAPARLGRPDDTAEFKAADVQESIRRAEVALASGKTLEPVSDVLMADGAPRHIATRPAPFNPELTLPPVTVPPATVPVRLSDGPAPARPAGAEPARRPEAPFRFLDSHLMEINFAGKVYIKQGTIYSYSGNLTFWVKEKRPAGSPALVIITGTGRVILRDKDREVTFMHVENEPTFVEPVHLLACEETLTPRYVPLEGSNGIDLVVLEGRGMVALSVASKPLPLVVTPDMPVSVPAGSIITWSGQLTPRVLDDQQLYEVMQPQSGPAGSLVRLEGSGRVLVEQTV